MTKNDKETLIALERAIKAGEECYFAFNGLAVVARVDFRFYGTDLYDAINICKAWKSGIEEKEGE